MIIEEYKKEKVLRAPIKYNKYALDNTLDHIKHKIKYLTINDKSFRIPNTKKLYLDYVLEDIYNHPIVETYGKSRELTYTEKFKYFGVFKQVISNINMDEVRLIESVALRNYKNTSTYESYEYYDDYYNNLVYQDEFFKEV